MNPTRSNKFLDLRKYNVNTPEEAIEFMGLLLSKLPQIEDQMKRAKRRMVSAERNVDHWKKKAAAAESAVPVIAGTEEVIQEQAEVIKQTQHDMRLDQLRSATGIAKQETEDEEEVTEEAQATEAPVEEATQDSQEEVQEAPQEPEQEAQEAVQETQEEPVQEVQEPQEETRQVENLHTTVQTEDFPKMKQHINAEDQKRIDAGELKVVS